MGVYAERQMYFKELAYMIVGVGRPKICKMLHLESKSSLKEAKIPLPPVISVFFW